MSSGSALDYRATATLSRFRQVKALVRKNILLRMRAPAQTVSDIITPLYFLVLLIILAITARPKVTGQVMTALPALTSVDCPGCIHIAVTADPTVEASTIDAVMAELTSLTSASESSAPKIVKFASPGVLENEYKVNTTRILTAVVLNNATTIGSKSGADGGPSVRYTLRTDFATITTGNPVDMLLTTTQAYIDRALINVHNSRSGRPALSTPLQPKQTDKQDRTSSDNSNANWFGNALAKYVTISKFTGSQFSATYVAIVAPFYMILAFQSAWLNPAVRVASERKRKLRTTLTAMGMGDFEYIMSIWLVEIAVAILLSLLTAIILVYAQAFPKQNLGVIFILMLLYLGTAASIGIMLASLAKDEQSAPNVITPLMIVSCGLFAAYYFAVQGKSVAGEVLLSLLAPVPFGAAINYLGKADAAQYMVTFGNMGSSDVMVRSFVMLAVDNVLYLALAWYLQRLFPGPDSRPMPWNFFFKPSYWRSGSSSSHPKAFDPLNNAAPSARMHTRTGTSLSGAFGSHFAKHLGLSNGNTQETELFELDDLSGLTSENTNIVTIQGLRKVFGTNVDRFGNPKRPTPLQKLGLRKMPEPNESKVAVDGLDLDLHAGQIVCLLGHNGAGKTTTVSMLSCALLPTSGHVRLFGRELPMDGAKDADYGAVDRLRQMLGICPQHDVLYETLTAMEHMRLFADVKGVHVAGGAAQLDSYLRQLLSDVLLGESVDKRAGDFSGGMKRRLSLAIALLGDPRLLLLDEVSSGVDEASKAAVWKLIEQYKPGRVIVLTTHDLSEADALGDRIAVMARGKLQALGSPMFLKRKLGSGYRVHFSKTQQSSRDPELANRIAQLVSTTINSQATVIKDGPADFTVRLASNVPASSLAVLFERVESAIRANDAGISGVGLSITTLEEVFLKLQDMDEGHEGANGDHDIYDDDDDEIVSQNHHTPRHPNQSADEVSLLPPHKLTEMDGLKRAHDQYYALLDRSLHGVTPFHQLQVYTGAPKPYVVASMAGLLFLFILFDIGASFITNVVGWAYPAYASIRAIESPASNDDTQWLTYWVVFSFLNVVEYFSGIILYFVPFYMLFKVLFVMWLYAPSTRGAEQLYGMIIRPVFVASPGASAASMSSGPPPPPPASSAAFEQPH
ncbi:hypothetical protein GQ42DRAFT_156172 [Ramicandelaber brevisporus]|nr:hypothetical protein GQ42DRAFT_156172 [Ramicandelaber brevisporus]